MLGKSLSLNISSRASLREGTGVCERSFLKYELLRVTFRSPYSAVSIQLWFLLKTVSGTRWYMVCRNFSFGCFTKTLSPTRILESLIGILLSARIFILSFWYESCSSIRAGFRLGLHRSAIEQHSLILTGSQKAIAGVTLIVK